MLEVLTGPDQDADGAAAVSASRGPSCFELTTATYLVGRRDEGRGILPEIDLSEDDAVSRRHALLTPDGARGFSLRDIGAANGTRLNGAELEPMVDYPLQEGDQITLGHGSRLRVYTATGEV